MQHLRSQLNLTSNEQRIVDFIERYISQKGYPPSNTEIHEHFGFRSKTSVRQYLRSLTKKGVLEWSEGDYKKRNLQLKNSPHTGLISSALVRVPLAGSIAAGPLTEAISDSDEIFLPPEMLGSSGEHFALRVRGDSMTGDHIASGDIVVLKKTSSFKNGDIVAVDLAGEATLKRIYKRAKHIELVASHPDYPPIVVPHSPQFRILGVFQMLIRK